ncbi:hypothetical protein Plhal304r1_c017g0061971 [Plasmopara halstedii]
MGAEKSIALRVQTENDDEDRCLRMKALGHVVELEGEIEARKKSVGFEESNDDAETEASEEYIHQQREKKE